MIHGKTFVDQIVKKNDKRTYSSILKAVNPQGDDYKTVYYLDLYSFQSTL